jgi:hypothetical protein
MTQIGFNSEENFVMRSSLVGAREVIKVIAEVVLGITPVRIEALLYVMTVRIPSLMLPITLSKVLLMFIRRTSAQKNVFLEKDVIKLLV